MIPATLFDMPRWMLGAALGAACLVAGCTEAPATITPGQPSVGEGQAGQSFEITVEPPPGQMPPPTLDPVSLPTVDLSQSELVLYRHPERRFSMEVPVGWAAVPQETTGDVVLGMVFQAPERNAHLSVTQFDNGEPPAGLGNTASSVLQMTGVTEQPGYHEVSRSDVIEREGEAMRVEVVYTRTDGVPMRSLYLFQIDGTTFSMVNMGVSSRSWEANEGLIHDMLASYRVPAVSAGAGG